MDTQTIRATQGMTEELLHKMGVQASSVVEFDESEVVKIRITPTQEGQSLGTLIGHRGETLRALQLILSMMVNRGREEWLNLWVDVDNYRLRHEENLKGLARRTAEKTLFLKEPVALFSMPAADRRVVHIAVAELEGVASESIGEEPERRVVIKPQG